MKFLISLRFILAVIMMTGWVSTARRPAARDYFDYVNRVNRHVDNSIANTNELSKGTETDNDDQSEPNNVDDTDGEDEQIDNAFLQTGAPVGTGLELFEADIPYNGHIIVCLARQRTRSKNKPIKPIQSNYVDNDGNDDDNDDENKDKKKGISHRFFGGHGADPSRGLELKP